MEARLHALGVNARIDIVPSGIDVAQFAGGARDDGLRARFGVPRDGAMLLSVGRLGREKNVALTLDAFARLADPRVRLVLIGDGAERDALERRAERLGIAARTVFAGEFPRASLPAAYRSADAFVFTSASETQGLVLVEALAAGIPVVAVDTPQTRDVLGGAGVVVPPDAGEVAAAVRAVLAAPGPRPVPEHVVRRFDAATSARRVIALYAELLAGEDVKRAG
jgi:glycosyltransferase involved in cell wall biosynthesis